MNSFNYYSPTEFIFGRDRENETGKYIQKYNGNKVLLHFGGGSVIRSGLLDRIKASLNAENIPFVTLGGVKPNPMSSLIYEGIKICKQEKINFILAVGGGSVIDSAKAIAIGSVYNGDFWDFFTGTKINDALPIGTVLTIAAAGSEGSPDAGITHEDGMCKRGASSDVIRPKFSIMNPMLTTTLSSYQTACGITDIMSHVFERYFTNTKNVDITDRLGEAVLLSVIKEGKKVIENPLDYEARANIMWAGMVSHNDSVGVGRDQDWGTHHLERELSAKYDCAHGAGLAALFPAWMTYVMKHDISRFTQFAVRVWGCQMNFEDPEATALEGIAAFKAFLKHIGMPTSLSELGVKEEDIPILVENMFKQNATHGSFIKLTEEDAREIYSLALNP